MTLCLRLRWTLMKTQFPSSQKHHQMRWTSSCRYDDDVDGVMSAVPDGTEHTVTFKCILWMYKRSAVSRYSDYSSTTFSYW